MPLLAIYPHHILVLNEDQVECQGEQVNETIVWVPILDLFLTFHRILILQLAAWWFDMFCLGRVS